MVYLGPFQLFSIIVLALFCASFGYVFVAHLLSGQSYLAIMRKAIGAVLLISIAAALLGAWVLLKGVELGHEEL